MHIFLSSMNLTEYLQSIVEKIPGIESIAVTDREGVEVFSTAGVSEETQVISVIFALTHEQVQKLEEFGETDYLYTEHQDGHSTLQLNAYPLHILINAKAVPRNVLVDAGLQCRSTLEPVRKLVLAANARMN